jgi:hypothetical protein
VRRASAEQVGVSQHERTHVLQPREGVVEAGGRPPLAGQRADLKAERTEAAVSGAGIQQRRRGRLAGRDTAGLGWPRRDRVQRGRRYTRRRPALHATTIRFADRGYTAIAHAADAQGISVSQYVREAALIRAVLDELDSAEEAIHTAHDLLAIAREVRRLAEVDPAGPSRTNASGQRSAPSRSPES